MLTEFHFDEEFLSATDISGSAAAMVNTILLDFWLNKGCLIFPYSSLAKYKEWEITIPPKYSKKWMTALNSAKRHDFNKNYKRMVEFNSLQELCELYKENCLDLILVPNEFNKLGFSDKVDILKSKNFEISKINGLLDSDSYRKSEKLSNSGIEANYDIRSIWNERFLKVAKHTKVITIVDRYFNDNLMKDITTHAHKTSLDNFIDFLTSSKTDNQYSITIYTDAGEFNSNKNIELSNFLRKRVKENPRYKLIIKNIKVISCEAEYFKKHSHDRFICFDEIVYEVGRGFEMFRTLDCSATTLTIKNIHCSSFKRSIGALIGGMTWNENF
ncbi:hypothetical protein [Providencia sp.]|uniref:hypothetical protein n=1 Tax=Providencia sp. TaxID=589 RepID=UPI001B7472E7|nr:hypothetical protein [Providencia sp.]MBP6122572.1 hypothetical protein [Providencia sp.]